MAEDNWDFTDATELREQLIEALAEALVAEIDRKGVPALCLRAKTS